MSKQQHTCKMKTNVALSFSEKKTEKVSVRNVTFIESYETASSRDRICSMKIIFIKQNVGTMCNSFH
jgi:hypothetical protein